MTFRFRVYPFRIRVIHKRLVFYYYERDGEAALKRNRRWWKISGFLYRGKVEVIFRKRGLRSWERQ